MRKDKIKQTFVTVTIGYGATVIGVGMLGILALYLGIKPMNGDVNNLVPQRAASYLGVGFPCLFFIMVIGSMASTAGSDLSALSSIVMTDIYGRNIATRARQPQADVADQTGHDDRRDWGRDLHRLEPAQHP